MEYPTEESTVFDTYAASIKQAVRYAEDLSSTYKKLRAVVDCMSDGMIAADGDFVVSDANQMAARLLECNREYLVGKPMKQWFKSDVFEQAMTRLKTLSKREIFEVKTDTPVKSVLKISASHLPGNTGFVFVLHDITAEKRASNLKREFLNILSHELRTPLNGIIGLTHILYDELSEGLAPEHSQYFEILKESENRMLKIVDELLKFAQFKGMEAANEKVSLSELFSVLIEEMNLLAAQKNISADYVCNVQDPFLKGDSELLYDLFSHLIRNAVIFGRPGGYVRVSLEQNNGAYEITVKDDGIGIPAKDMEKIFDSFYQVEEHMTRNVEGLGLGLTIARHIAEFHKGSVSMESKLGQGAACTVRLPLHPKC